MALKLSNMKGLIQITWSSLRFNRFYGSALHIPGNKATEVCAVVFPYIDMEERFKDMETLKGDMMKRHSAVDIEEVKKVWDFYTSVCKDRDSLEKTKTDITNKIKQLVDSKTKESTDEYEKLKIHTKIVRDDIKNLKVALWSVEENAVTRALAVPNILHSETPDSEEFEIYIFNDKPDLKNIESHLDKALRLNLLKFSSPHSYYLLNDAAVFELSAKFYFTEQLRNAGLVQFSNPDFTKSLVVEGCGLNHTDPESVYILHHDENTKVNEDSRLHLNGGASLLAFAAYYTRNVMFPTVFPLRYFAMGRQYKPVPIDSGIGLFGVSQASAIEVFVACKDSKESLNNELDDLVTKITDIYKSIGYHFKVCHIPACHLYNWESLRVSFQMFSPSLNKYIEIGNISVSDSYISKRLQFCYREGKYRFPKLISGTVLSVPKLLGCILEQNGNLPFEIPVVIKNMF